MRQNLRKWNIRLAALMMAFALLLCTAPAVSAAEASGTCGDKLSWTLSGDTLTITGSGAMYDYPEGTMAPWYDYRREISTVHLPSGLTRIGNLAFYGCTALKSVSMPDSVTEVGWYAFSGCTGLTMLDLSSNLKTIEDGGFRECTSLPAVRLPGSLTSIGYQGFYRCESLTEITIPASVEKLGYCAFSFCYSLVRVNIQAPISRLPDWTFYGCSQLTDITLPSTLTGAEEFAFYNCTSLSNVVYTGSEANKEQITADIQRDLAGQTEDYHVSDRQYDESSSNATFEATGGNVTGNSITTTQTGNASVSSRVDFTYNENDGSSNSTADVTVTLENPKGWDEISNKVTETVENSDKASVDVYIKDKAPLGDGALTDLAGKNVTVTVHNSTGSVWKIDCATLEADAAKDAYDLSYERSDATPEQLELMGCTLGYQIKFASDAQINAEVMIKLPVENARKNASLYQVKRDGLELAQTVMVDNEGYAHFYLASVDRRTEYLIGIDVPAVEPEEAIIPEVLFREYGITDNLSDTKYVVTGRTSSWGMNFQQVTWIMIAVLVTVVVVVGFIMFALNKRKLKMGYIPDLDEEYE